MNSNPLDLTVFRCLVAYVTFVKTHSTEAHAHNRTYIIDNKVQIAQNVMDNVSDNKQPSKRGISSCFVTAQFLVLPKENQIAFTGLRTTRLNKTKSLFKFSRTSVLRKGKEKILWKI